MGTTSVVAIYQAPQSAYDIFDKVCVLYEGEQIYFGRTTDAKKFFVDMGFYCPPQQTTPDFLTSLTSAAERTPREGFEGKIPTTPEEFAAAWKRSDEYKRLLQDIAEFNERHPVKGERYEQFLASRRAQQSKHVYVRPSLHSVARLTCQLIARVGRPSHHTPCHTVVRSCSV